MQIFVENIRNLTKIIYPKGILRGLFLSKADFIHARINYAKSTKAIRQNVKKMAVEC